MVNINSSAVTIGGRSYNKDKSGYPALPTVFSGVEIQWGAGSCIEHPEPSRATLSLWVPKTDETFLPALGEVVEVKAEIGAGGDLATSYSVMVFAGKVEAVKVQDDHKADGGYRVNVTAADALAEAARLRLSDSMWPFEDVITRQRRITDLAIKAGAKFSSGDTEAQGYSEAIGTRVRARDVDSFPALEAFQRTTMAAGHTVLSAGNIVQPSIALNLPQVLLGDQPATGVVYGYDSNGYGKHTQTTNGVLTRTNWASNASAATTGYFHAAAGTGGTVYVNAFKGYGSPKYGNSWVRAEWTVSATGGTQAFYYQQPGITGLAGSPVSAGMWVRSSVQRNVTFQVYLMMDSTTVGNGTSTVYTLPANTWTYIKYDGVTASADYNTVDVNVVPQTNMLSGQYIEIDGVLIEKTATGGDYFDRYTLDAAADVVASERTGIPVFDASVIVDDVFELDTSNVVNEIKVEMKRFIGSVGEPGWEAGDDANQEFDQVFTDDEGSKKTTPQTRSIATDWAIQDAYMDDLLPSSTMVTKGRLLLAGQSKPQWRMSSGMTLVLGQVPTQEAIYSLLREIDRFGALVRIDNGPSFISQYMRVRGGRIVLGENPVMELNVEPVEYSAPIPLSRATLQTDEVASNYRITNFKTLTSNDLRTIGAR